MKLERARVTNYKNVIDSGEFTLEDMTCLVGKNESGKSALLEALAGLNAVDNELKTFDSETQYPRIKLSEYEESDSVDTVVTTWWRLSESEIEHLTELVGVNPLSSPVVEIKKDYSNQVTIEPQLDYLGVVKHLLSESGLSATDKKPLESSTTTSELIGALKKLKEPTNKQALFRDEINEKMPDGVRAIVRTAVNGWLPMFLYYADYYRLPGQISVEQLQQRIADGSIEGEPGLRVFLALLAMANSSVDDLLQIDTSERLISSLEGVENRLTSKIFEYWSQNKHLEIRFRLDPAKAADPPPFDTGNVFRTRIRNNRHKATIGLEHRSTGFVWFFSFLVWFSDVKRLYGDNLLILLDEPGLSLHAKAQADLLRYFENELVPFHQLVYTTHSPFMIDPSNLLMCRTVEDILCPNEEVVGTKVGQEVLSTDADTVFPLQAALGYDITQSLFVGEHTLLVEGPSDLLYLRWASDKLQLEGRTALDPRWTVTPCGGITKVPSFLALFGGNQLHVAVLVDYATGDKRKVDDLRSSELLRSGHVFTPDMYLPDSATEADTEDLLGVKVYTSLVNATYELSGSNLLDADSLSELSPRVVKAVEERFRLMDPSVPEFDHYAPARYLFEANADELSDLGVSARALDSFEALFEDLNGLLSLE